VKKVNGLPELEGWDAQSKVTGLCPAPPLGKHHKWPRKVADTPEKRCERCGQRRMVREPFNPVSHHQCAHLFHDLLGLPREQNKKREWSVDDEVLERLEWKHPKHKALFGLVRDARNVGKQLGFLKSRQTPDGRMPSSFNVAAAWTSRFSSSKNPYGLGTNLQNISEKLRYIFIADPGKELFYADLERAESLVVAFVSGDGGYIEAHNGDTHTLVASLLWPELPWTGEPKADKAVAEALPEWDQAPGHNFRFQAKRIQHGSNFGLQPKGIARIAHIPEVQARNAQGRYFEAFPGIKTWQGEMRRMVEAQEPIVNPFGFEVSLFGRPWDDHTWRQGLSLVPQSTVAHVLNLGLLRVWRDLDLPEEALAQLMAQVHDAILGQWPKERRLEAARAVKERMLIPFQVRGFDGKVRVCTIPVEIMAGANWSKKNLKAEKGRLNPGGMEVLHV
jgi:DNA polymerase-1